MVIQLKFFCSRTRDIPDSQNTMKNNGASWTDVDIQCVPTTPFFEQYSSPSLYSSNEPPLPTPMAWMPAPRRLVQDFEQGTVQRLQTVRELLLMLMSSSSLKQGV